MDLYERASRAVDRWRPLAAQHDGPRDRDAIIQRRNGYLCGYLAGWKAAKRSRT